MWFKGEARIGTFAQPDVCIQPSIFVWSEGDLGIVEGGLGVENVLELSEVGESFGFGAFWKAKFVGSR